eukprot:8426736-Pyramimonas_sp.AAC.1
MSLSRLDMSKTKLDLLWIALSESPTEAICSRDRRRAWNLAQLMVEVLRLSCDVMHEGSARHRMWETSGLMRLESVTELRA